MPIYEIESPDGQVLEIESDRFPTGEELQKITSTLFPTAPKDTEAQLRQPVDPLTGAPSGMPIPSSPEQLTMQTARVNAAIPEQLKEHPVAPYIDPIWSPEGELGVQRKQMAQTGIPAQFLKPAIRKIGGDVVVGEQGDTHPDIIDRNSITAKDLDMKGFVDPMGKFYGRPEAAKLTGAPTEREPGRLHSTDVIREQEASSLSPVTGEAVSMITPEGQRLLPGSELPAPPVRYGAPPEVRRAEEEFPTGIPGGVAGEMTTREANEYAKQSVDNFDRMINKSWYRDLHGEPPSGREIADAMHIPLALGIPLSTADKLLTEFFGWATSVSGATQIGLAELDAVKPLMLAKWTKDMAESGGEAAFTFWDALKKRDYQTASDAGGGLMASIAMMTGGPAPSFKGRKFAGFKRMPGLPESAVRSIPSALNALEWGQGAHATRMALEAEPTIGSQLKEINAKLASMDVNDPARADLIAQQEWLQKREDAMAPHQDALQQAAEADNRSVVFTDKPLSKSGTAIAHPNPDGTITVNRDAFRRAVEIDAGGDPAKVEDIINGLISEEFIHSEIPDADAAAWWKSLSWLERKLEEKLYDFDADASDAMKGQEALRRRMQVLNNLTPLEQTKIFATERWTNRSIMGLESMVQKLRERMPKVTRSTKVLATQKEILDRIAQNLQQKKGARYAVHPEAAQPVRDVRPQPQQIISPVSSEEDRKKAGEGGGQGEVAKAAQVPLVAPQLKDAHQQIHERLLGNDPEGAQVIMNDEMEYWKDVFKKDPDFADENVRQPIIDSLDNLQKAIDKAKAPPTARTEGGPTAAPASVEAKPGVAAPVERPIKPPTAGVATRQDLISEIDRKEKIASKYSGDYKGSRGTKDFYVLKNPYLPEGTKGSMDQVVVPAGSPIEVIDAKLKEIAERFNEPFAKRKPAELADLSQEDFFKMIKGIPGGYGPKAMQDFAKRVTSDQLPSMIAERDRLYRELPKKLKAIEEAGGGAAPAELWQDYNLAQLKSQTLNEWIIHSPDMVSPMEPAAKRVGRYHEGVPKKDIPLILSLVKRDGWLTMDGIPIESPIGKHVAASVIADGYDTTWKFYADKIEETYKTLRDNGIDPDTSEQYQQLHEMMNWLKAMYDQDVGYGPPSPNVDIDIAARRGKWKPLGKEQLPLGLGTAWVLPGEKKDILGKPVERSLPEGVAGAPMTAQQIKENVAKLVHQDVQFGSRPSRKGPQYGPEQTVKVTKFKDVVEWAKNNIGPAAGKTALATEFKDAVHAELENASPERLGELVKAFDLREKLRLGMDEKGNILGIPGAEEGFKFELESLKEGEKATGKRKRREGQETIYRAGKKFVGTREKRAQIESAIANEWLKDTLPKADLDRASVTLEDIDFGNRDTQHGVVRKLTPAEATDLDSINEIVRDEARVKGQPVSNTKRLLAVVDKSNGQVHLLSTYNDGGTQMIVDPARAGIGDRPNVPLDVGFLRKYRPMTSVLLSEPVKNFRQKFGSVGQWVQAIEKQGLEFDRPREATFAGEGAEETLTAREERAREEEYNRRLMTGRAELEEQAGEEPRGTSVVQGEGGMIAGGPGAEAARVASGMSKGEIEKAYSAPLQSHELESVLDYLTEEVGDIKGIEDVLLGFEGLIERAKLDLLDQQRRQAIERKIGSQKHINELESIQKLKEPGKLTKAEITKLTDLKKRLWKQMVAAPERNAWLGGRERSAIAALQKISQKILDRSYDPETKQHTKTPDEAKSEALRQIADNITSSDTVEDYINKTIAQFGPEPEGVGAVRGVAKIEYAKPGVSRELTAPAKIRKPTSRYPLPRTEPEVGAQVPEQLQGKPVVEPTREPMTGGITGLPEGWPAGGKVGQRQWKDVTTSTGEPMFAEYPTVKPIPGKPGKEPTGMFRGQPPEMPFEAEAPVETKRTATRGPRQRPSFVIKRPPEKRPFELRGEGELPPVEAAKEILGPLETPKEPGARRSMPAAMRRAVDQLDSAIRRRTVMRDIPRTLDGLENTSQLEAHDAINNIITTSMDKGLRGKDQSAEAEKLRMAAIAVQSTIQKPTRKEIRRAKREARKAGVDYVPPTPVTTPAMINTLIAKAEQGMFRANQLIRGSRAKPATAADKWVGRRWLAAASKLRDAAEAARDNWSNPLLHETVDAVKTELKTQLGKERSVGMDTQEFFNYLPGLYEGEIYNEGLLNWGSWNILGRNYRQPKKFANYYDAIADGPYIPASYDVAHIVGNRIRRGNHIVARRQWQESLKGITDPTSGKPISINPRMVQREVPVMDPETLLPKVNEETGEKIFRTEWGWESPNQDHVLLNPSNGKVMRGPVYGMKPIVVRKGFESIVTGSLSQSAIRDYDLGRAALKMTSALKHGWILMLDSFHLGRLSQYELASTRVSQMKDLAKRGGYKGGYSALSYRPEDLARAVDRGMVSKDSYDWAMQEIPIHIGRGRTVPMTRHQIMREFVLQGLNAGKVADALYKDTVAEMAKNIPVIRQIYGKVIAPYNKFLFDQFVPGAIAETAMRNFEAMHASNPNVPFHKLMRDIIRDTNATYGNMGRQGVFRDATLRDILQLTLLAPSWREGLFQKEARYIYRLGAKAEQVGRKGLSALGTGVDPSKNILMRLTGREGLPVMGSLGAMMTRGLISYFMLGQLVNLVSRGKFTWQNEEEGRKMDAFIPVGKNGIWLPTLGVFGEITGDIVRYGETKGNAWEQLLQVGINSLGPVGRAVNVMAQRQTPMGQKLTTTRSILGAAAMEVVPPPISLGTAIRGAGHMIAPQRIAPNEPGAVPQRIAGAFGLKVHRGIDAMTQIHRMAREWGKSQNIPEPTIDITQTEEDSLSKFRHAIRIGDKGGATRIYRTLLDRYDRMPRGKGYEKFSNEEMILRAMKIWRNRPFTGSEVKEDEFRSSLSGAGREIYSRADAERMEQYEDIVDFIQQQDSR